jgi:urocanate hydratase
MAAGDLQLDTMRIYRALTAQREDWGGKLVLMRGTGLVQSGASAAVSIAGGTSLALDADASATKAAQRAGYLDFVVNSLDEALRALKNEIRQKRPLSVGLIADVDATLAEMDQRGIQPDLRFDPASLMTGPQPSEECHFAATDAAGLCQIDSAVLAVLPPNALVRRRWLQYAPQFVREARTGGRWIWLSGAELDMLAATGFTPEPHS